MVIDGQTNGLYDCSTDGVKEDALVGPVLGKKVHFWEEEGVPVKMSPGEVMTVPTHKTHFKAVR